MLVHLQLLLSHLNSIPHQSTRCADCSEDCRDFDRQYKHTMGYLAGYISEGINDGIRASLSKLHDDLAAHKPANPAERRAYEQCLLDLRLSIGHLQSAEAEAKPPFRRALCAVK